MTMAKRSIESRAQELLEQAQHLVQTSGLTWLDVNNAIFRSGGPFARLFPSAKDRAAFAKTTESQQIDRLIDSLPDPPTIHNGGSTAANSMCACPSRSTPRLPAKRKPRV